MVHRANVMSDADPPHVHAAAPAPGDEAVPTALTPQVRYEAVKHTPFIARYVSREQLKGEVERAASWADLYVESRRRIENGEEWLRKHEGVPPELRPRTRYEAVKHAPIFAGYSETRRDVKSDVEFAATWSDLPAESRRLIEGGEEWLRKQERKANRGPVARGLATVGHGIVLSWAMLLILIPILAVVGLVLHALTLPLIPALATLAVIALLVLMLVG
jgi:hypothetical protein